MLLCCKKYTQNYMGIQEILQLECKFKVVREKYYGLQFHKL